MSDQESIILPAFQLPGRGQTFASSFQFMMRGEDNLRLTVFNSLAGVDVTVQGRIQRPNGDVFAFTDTLTPTADRMPTSKLIPVGEGVLLNVVAFASAGSPRVGQTFVQLKVIQGLSGATRVLGTLIQGYVTAHQERAWPGSPVETSLDGGGFLHIINFAASPAGTEWFIDIPAGARWQLQFATGNLQTDGTVFDRRPSFTYTPFGAGGWRAPAAAAIPGAFIGHFQWLTRYPVMDTSTNALYVAPAPGPIDALAGGTFATQTVNLQLGDQWVSFSIAVLEWLEAQ